MNRRDFLATGALVAAPALPETVLAGTPVEVTHVSRENLELELAGLENLLPLLYRRRKYLQDRLCRLDSARWVEHLDYVATATPTRQKTIVGGVTRDTMLDGFALSGDADFLIVDMCTRLEICKWAFQADARESPKRPFSLFGIPCFVSKKLMRDTARFVQLTDAKLFHIVEVSFV